MDVTDDRQTDHAAEKCARIGGITHRQNRLCCKNDSAWKF